MKTQFLIPLALVMSLILIGLMKVRKREFEKEERQHKLHDIKLQVTNDFLNEYEAESADTNDQLGKVRGDLKTTQEEVADLTVLEQRMKEDLLQCQQKEKSDSDLLAEIEIEFNNLKTEIEKEKTVWDKEIAVLTEQLAGRSAICDFLKKGMSNAGNICGDKEPEEENEEALEENPIKEKKPTEEDIQEEKPKKEQAKDEDVKKEEAEKAEEEANVDAFEQKNLEVEVKNKEEKAEVPKMKESIVKKKKTL